MNLDELKLATNVIVPLVGSLSDVVVRLMSGIASFTTAAAEIRDILSMASTRLDDEDKVFAARDARHDARVAALTAPELGTEAARRANRGETSDPDSSDSSPSGNPSGEAAPSSDPTKP